jgi:tetratricopeptide (TPR) repeat protein
MDVEALLRQGISAARAGRQKEARELLSQVLDLDPENESAWLWMSSVVPDEEKIVCLRNVMATNPSNELARMGLEALLKKAEHVTTEEPRLPGVEAPREEPEPAVESEPTSVSEEEVSGERRSCAAWAGLGLLAVLAVSACVVAAVFGMMVLRSGHQGAASPMVDAAIPTETSTPAPDYTPTATWTPTPTRTPAPTNTLVVPDARIPGFPIVSEGAYDEVEARVRGLRGLDSTRKVERVTFTRYRLEEYLNDWYRAEEHRAEMETLEELYRVLGLIDEEYDLVEAEIAMLREYVAGLYDTGTQEIYLVMDRYTSDLLLELTFAHEFTHALQDQNFDLGSLDERSSTTDSRLALQALMEGDASLVMVEYAYRHLFEMSFDRTDLLQAIQQVEQGEYQDAPSVVRQTAWFPYQQGVVFAAALVEQGGWAQLDQALRNPPQTTEQVMHPDKYLAGEVGSPPEVGNLLGVLGAGWEETSRDVLGELFIRVYLERELGSEEALMAGEGWEGDRAVLLLNEAQDQHAFVLRISWDSEPNADEFLLFYSSFMQRSGAGRGITGDPRYRRWQTGDQVTCLIRQREETLLVIASDAETADLVVGEFPGF